MQRLGIQYCRGFCLAEQIRGAQNLFEFKLIRVAVSHVALFTKLWKTEKLEHCQHQHLKTQCFRRNDFDGCLLGVSLPRRAYLQNAGAVCTAGEIAQQNTLQGNQFLKLLPLVV